MRRGIDAQYPEIDRWSDEQLLGFRQWVCPVRNNEGKPAASVLVRQRYDVSDSVAYVTMYSSAC